MKISHQQYFNHSFPKEERHDIRELKFGNRGGEFPLKIKGFDNLIELVLHDIHLTKLDIRDCSNLEKITISRIDLNDDVNIFTCLDTERFKELVINECDFSVLNFQNLLISAERFKKLTISRDGVFIKLGENWNYQNQIVQKDN
jgi:hypothetical protein